MLNVKRGYAMENFLIQNSKRLANNMIESLKTEDIAVSPPQSVESICNSKLFLHYLVAKKLGFPVTLSRKRLNRPDNSDQKNNTQEDNQYPKTRFLFNNKKTGGKDHGDQIEI
jgi:hypothetical protein